MANPPGHTDIGIYIRDGSIDKALDWLRGRLKGLHLVEPAMPDEIYHGTHDGQGVSVIVGSREDDTDHSHWLEVFVTSDAGLPWASDVAFAREAFRVLRSEVRCIPGELRKSGPMNPFEWWAITETSEGLISWYLQEPE